jgi:thiol-disulfide isomerase/thioredoxin
VIGTLVALAVAIGIFAGIRWISTASVPPAPTPSLSTLSQVLTIIDGLNAPADYAVGTGGAQNLLQPLGGSPLVANGKPLILYVGAEYCPYCAAMRWPLVIALARFGTWSDLVLTASSPSDVFPNTPTFSFYHATYSSSYFTLQTVEVQDLNKKPLQSPSAEQSSLLKQLDSKGGIPFFVFANNFALNGSTYSPGDLANLNALELATGLLDPSTKPSQDILGSANLLTAALCVISHQTPANVCANPAIQAIKL